MNDNRTLGELSVVLLLSELQNLELNVLKGVFSVRMKKNDANFIFKQNSVGHIMIGIKSCYSFRLHEWEQDAFNHFVLATILLLHGSQTDNIIRNKKQIHCAYYYWFWKVTQSIKIFVVMLFLSHETLCVILLYCHQKQPF